MRIVLVGSVESTRVALGALVREGEAPLALVTLLPAKSHRHSDFVDLRPACTRWGVPLIEVDNVNEPSVLEKLRALHPDHVMVIGWSQICSEAFLALSARGALGYHPAELPCNRGRAVLPWTILQGLEHTGGTLFWMESGVDCGDILAQKRFAVAPDETATTLVRKHMQCLDQLMTEAVGELRSGRPRRIPQNHSQATFCSRRTPRDGLIDWSKPARDLWTLVRASTAPYPGAYTYSKRRRLVIWEAQLVGAAPYIGLPGQVQAFRPDGALVQCGDGGHVLLQRVQLHNEEPRPAAEVLNIHEKLGLDLEELFKSLTGGSHT